MLNRCKLFFGSADLGLDIAHPGAFTLVAGTAMHEALSKDYEAMAGMVFGEVPKLEAVLASVEQFEQTINRATNATTERTGRPDERLFQRPGKRASSPNRADHFA